MQSPKSLHTFQCVTQDNLDTAGCEEDGGSQSSPYAGRMVLVSGDATKWREAAWSNDCKPDGHFSCQFTVYAASSVEDIPRIKVLLFTSSVEFGHLCLPLYIILMHLNGTRFRQVFISRTSAGTFCDSSYVESNFNTALAHLGIMCPR